MSSYIVTARKWRPQSFSDVVSQKHVTATLKSAIKNERVGHAYLFSGPRGVGKTTVARIFAKALNCERGPAEEPCNECDNCRAIQSGVSLDVQELDGASNNSVEDVRNLISTVGYHASRCRYKMYIIDEVHMLTQQAFNALLKTLEEPPPNVVFVFATTEPHKILPTILSRCQRFDFHRLGVTEIAGKLRRIADADSISIDDESLMLIAQRAGGAMRDGESILEQLKASHSGLITVAEVNDILGIADRTVYFDLMDHCHSGDLQSALSLFNDHYRGGGDLKEFIEGLLGHLRDMMYAALDGGMEQVMLADNMKARLAEQSGWYGQADIVRMVGYLNEAETSLAFNAVLPILRIETAIARIALMERTVQIEELITRLSGGDDGGNAQMPQKEARTQRKPDAVQPSVQNVPKPARSRTEKADTSASDMSAPVYDDYDDTAGDDRNGAPDEPLQIKAEIGAIEQNWIALVKLISARKPSVGPSLATAFPTGFADGTLTLAFSGPAFHRRAIEAEESTISEILTAVMGVSTTLKCVDGDTGDSGDEKKNDEFDELIAREPVIRDILDAFDGEIIDTWRET